MAAGAYLAIQVDAQGGGGGVTLRLLRHHPRGRAAGRGGNPHPRQGRGGQPHSQPGSVTRNPGTPFPTNLHESPPSSTQAAHVSESSYPVSWLILCGQGFRQERTLQVEFRPKTQLEANPQLFFVGDCHKGRQGRPCKGAGLCKACKQVSGRKKAGERVGASVGTAPAPPPQSPSSSLASSSPCSAPPPPSSSDKPGEQGGPGLAWERTPPSSGQGPAHQLTGRYRPR